MTTCTRQILHELHRQDDWLDVQELARILDRPWLESLCKTLDTLTADKWLDNSFVGRTRYVALRHPWSVTGKRLEGEKP